MCKTIRKSLSKQVADLIEEQIKSGEYQIGDKLPSEPVLVETFGVSRNTLREAIQALTNSGLLETKQGDGTYVIAKERLQVEFFNFMNTTNDQNILEVRELLEKHIAVSAIKHSTPEDVAEISFYLHRRNQQTSSMREASQADLNFHIAIAKATHNDIILNVYRYVSEYFNEFIYKKLRNPQKCEQDIDEIHELLFQAIQSKNVKQALDCVNRIIEL